MTTIISLGYENLFQNFKQDNEYIEETGLKLRIDKNFIKFCKKYGVKHEVLYFLLVSILFKIRGLFFKVNPKKLSFEKENVATDLQKSHLKVMAFFMTQCFEFAEKKKLSDLKSRDTDPSLGTSQVESIFNYQKACS
jgi:hypothetical protein